jgi:predicted alpha/beta-fold hydrolase
LWSQYFRRRRLPAMRLERLATPDGDTVHLYHRDVAGARARVFLLHGLEGSVHSHYVQGIVRGAEAKGWSTTVLVFRGCGPEFNVAPRMYHSGETSDLRFALAEVIASRPTERVLLAGVSLGGNVVLKYLGEEAKQVSPRIVAAAAVSVPYDLEAGSRNLQRGFARVYDRHFLRSLRRKALRKLAQHPGLFDPTRLRSARTIEDFDDAVTGPVHGFGGSHDYYARSSSIHFLDRIAVPTFLLSAADDPFLPADVLTRVAAVAGRNPLLEAHFTARGGHVGFLSGAMPFLPVHWGEERVLSFFEAHA